MRALQVRGRVHARFWLPLGAAVSTALAVAHVAWLNDATTEPRETSLATPLWMVLAPAVILAMAALGLFNEARGRQRAGRALAGVALAMACYQLLLAAVTPESTSQLPPLMSGAVNILGQGGWMVVLAASQLCALAVFGLCSGTRKVRLERFVVAALVAGIATTALGPEVAGVVVLLWMSTLAVVPVALWLAVVRFHGRRRLPVLQVALGSVVPALVVLICGVLAVAVGFGASDRGTEIDVLGAGFLLGQLGSAVLFTSALESLEKKSWSPQNSAATVSVRIALWGVYLLAAAQAGAVAGAAWGGEVVDVAVTTTVVVAAGAPLWRKLVAWCEVLANPRRAAAAALVRAGGQQSLRSPGPLAREVLQKTLGDPELAVLLALSEDRYITPEGVAVPLSPGATVLRDPHGTAIAAVVISGNIAEGRRMAGPGPVLEVVRPLLERAALQGQVLDQAAQVTAERARADNAALVERSRLERDLHDGVQGRILALGLTLDMARGQLADGQAQLLMGDAVAALADVLAELRGLANGNVPRVLSRDGLVAAVADFVGRIPVPVGVELPALRLGPEVEAVAYFVIAEAVTNALKHARCGSVAVSGHARDGVFSLSIRDDGCGGADPRAGSGLRGLGERVHAAGGRLLISDATPGTLVEVSLPCAP